MAATSRYTRDMILEAQILAGRRGNRGAVEILNALLSRMKHRRSVPRGFLTPEESGVIDWAQTSDAA